MHKLFSTNYLLQELRLNPSNYPKQELIMNIFVWTANSDLNLNAKIQSISQYK
jgi:hypothetical protein